MAQATVPPLTDLCVTSLVNATQEETGGHNYGDGRAASVASWPLAAQQLEHLISRPLLECAYCAAWMLEEHATPVIAMLDLFLVGTTEAPCSWTLCKACSAEHLRGGATHRGLEGLVEGSTLLHDAAKRGDACTVTRLLRLGLDPDERSSRGHTPLMDAVFELEGVRRGNVALDADALVAVVSTLVDSDASLTCHAPAAGASSLHLAAEEASALGARIIGLMLDKLPPADIDTRTRDGDSPLGLACLSGCAASVPLLLAAGASVKHRNHRSATLLHMAVEALPKSNGIACIKALVATAPRRAEVLSTLESVTVGDGDTALLSAVRLGNGACCELLLQLGASPHVCSANGSSAIASAVFLQERQCTTLLLAAGADPQIPLPPTLLPLVTRGAVMTPAKLVEGSTRIGKRAHRCRELVRECVARNRTAPLSAIDEAKKVANARYQRGEHQQAVQDYERAIEQWRAAGAQDAALTRLYAYNNLGAALFANCAASHLQLGAAESALGATAKCLELVPRHVKALLRQATAYENVGNRAAAICSARDALLIEPHNAQAKSVLCAGGAGSIAVRWVESDYEHWGEKPVKEVRTLSAPLSLLAALEHALCRLDESRVPAAALVAFTAATLRLHVIGCAGGVDAACEWAAVPARLPFCEAVEVTLVGFLGTRCARPAQSPFARPAPPPLDRAAPRPDDRQRVGCQTFLHSLHGLYHALPPQSEGREPPRIAAPHVALLRDPQLGLHLDQWAETIWRLIEQRTLTVVAFGSDEEGQSRMWPDLETILRRLGARILPIADTQRGTPCVRGMFYSPRKRKELREVVQTCAFLGPDDTTGARDGQCETSCYRRNMELFQQGGLDAALPPIIDDLAARGIRTLQEVQPLQGMRWRGILGRYSF